MLNTFTVSNVGRKFELLCYCKYLIKSSWVLGFTHRNQKTGVEYTTKLKLCNFMFQICSDSLHGKCLYTEHFLVSPCPYSDLKKFLIWTLFKQILVYLDRISKLAALSFVFIFTSVFQLNRMYTFLFSYRLIFKQTPLIIMKFI